MRNIFFVVFFTLCTACYGEVHLTCEQSAVLHVFFQNLIKESEVGYVLFNEKPVCIQGFYTKDPFCVGFSSHIEATALKEGARIWKQISNSAGNNDSDIILNITENEDSNLQGQLHILAINIPLLRQVVNNNIVLFKYILGPTFSTDDFLNTLKTNKQHFYKLLKGNKVLIGIILGYGTENSLFGSRLESVMEILENQRPPFLPLDLVSRKVETEYLPFDLAFGYTSIKEELESLETKIVVSTDKLSREKPEYIFGCIKDSLENKKFTKVLEETQTQIQIHLKSPKFLMKTLEKLGCKNHIPCVEENFKFKYNEGKTEFIIAKGIWDALENYDFEFLPSFIDGFEKRQTEIARGPREADLPSYRRVFMEARQNLLEANKFFNGLAQDSSYHCIIPKLLYYKTNHKEEISDENQHELVLLSYSVFSPSDHSIENQSHVWINLNNSISGFAHGIKSMKMNETRELYIHPSLAYGFDTSLEKCVYLKVIVTMEGFGDADEEITPIAIKNLSFLADPSIIKQRDENYRLALENKGGRLAKHLERLTELDLCKVVDHMRLLYENHERFSLTSPREQSQINQIHWNIYFGLSSVK